MAHDYTPHAKNAFMALLGKGFETGAKGAQAADEQKSALERLLKGKSADLSNRKEEIAAEHEARQEDLEDKIDTQNTQFEKMKNDPTLKGRGFSIDGMSVTAPDWQKHEAAQARTDAAEARETAAVQARWKDLAGKDTEEVDQAENARKILQDPNTGNTTLLRDNLARAAVGGRVPQAMAQGILGPQSLKERFVGTLGGLLGHPEWNPLTDDQKTTYLKNLDTMSAPARARLQAAQDNINSVGPTLAPTLSRSGKLPGVLKAYGAHQAAIGSSGGGPAVSPVAPAPGGMGAAPAPKALGGGAAGGSLSPEERAELEALKKEMGQ